ncbi:MAG: enoyl-CoA hydratase, partial [Deltaproteobacteria bacterium]|nr:enoyl-CoA hydratase [Deltaproteobacteria bacterium]
MNGIRTDVSGGVAELIIDNPPVNALGVAGWRAFAET